MIGFKESAYAILDAVDGKFIQSIDNRDPDEDYIAWDDGDTFIIDGTIGHFGVVLLTNSLKENGEDLFTRGICLTRDRLARGREVQARSRKQCPWR